MASSLFMDVDGAVICGEIRSGRGLWWANSALVRSSTQARVAIAARLRQFDVAAVIIEIGIVFDAIRATGANTGVLVSGVVVLTVAGAVAGLAANGA